MRCLAPLGENRRLTFRRITTGKVAAHLDFGGKDGDIARGLDEFKVGVGGRINPTQVPMSDARPRRHMDLLDEGRTLLGEKPIFHNSALSTSAHVIETVTRSASVGPVPRDLR